MSENPKTNRSTMETSGLKHKEHIQHTSKNSKDDLIKLLNIYLTNVTKDSSKEEMELEKEVSMDPSPRKTNFNASVYVKVF